MESRQRNVGKRFATAAARKAAGQDAYGRKLPHQQEWMKFASVLAGKNLKPTIITTVPSRGKQPCAGRVNRNIARTQLASKPFPIPPVCLESPA